jgi:hypothetical protein
MICHDAVDEESMGEKKTLIHWLLASIDGNFERGTLGAPYVFRNHIETRAVLPGNIMLLGMRFRKSVTRSGHPILTAILDKHKENLGNP